MKRARLLAGYRRDGVQHPPGAVLELDDEDLQILGDDVEVLGEAAQDDDPAPEPDTTFEELVTGHLTGIAGQLHALGLAASRIERAIAGGPAAPAQVHGWTPGASEPAPEAHPTREHDLPPLIDISGIGPKTAARLRVLGVESVAALAALDDDALAHAAAGIDVVGDETAQLRRWRDDARALVGEES